MSALVRSAALLLLPIGVSSYSWTFSNTPTQCGNLSISLSGSGTAPYNLLIIPAGSTPYSNGTEVRTIVSHNFSSSSTSFQLKYPADSQFVAVLSDASSVGSGGTSVVAEVTSSSDSSCIDASKSVSPSWDFNLDPSNTLSQCSATRIWWNPSNNVSGTPSFFGVIPGGNSFEIPNQTLIPLPILELASHGRGEGSGGSTELTVGTSLQNDASCLNDSSPSSTAGNPAGGTYPTNASGGETGGGSSGGNSTNVGAIVGGVVGGVVALLALLLVFYFLRRRSKQNKKFKEKPVDLLQADEGDERANVVHRPPEYYQPEPFVVPEPSSEEGSSARPLSGSERPSSRSGTPDIASTSNGTRKSGLPPSTRRVVNIIQHDDAGPSETTKEPETIELPPAYTNIRT